MPNKPTDSEIVKALECCIDVNGANCHECPYDECCSYPKSTMLEDALDLINRLQAENDRKDKIFIDLLKTSSERADIISGLKAENERLKKGWKADAIRWIIADAKAEAYKEFAEKLKEIAISRYDAFDEQEYPSVKLTDLDNLLKELVGE